uniref:RNA-directed DNA polymerase n=1 Tax=Strongyloides papillosus TaxID=174720 RepID=A0A0N5BIP6_STREA
MPSKEEKLKSVLSAANELGLNISNEVVPGKKLSVINLLLRGYSDKPEELVENIRLIVADIKRLLKTTTVLVKKPKAEEKTEKMARYDLSLYKTLPVFEGESSFVNFYEQFKDAMEFAVDDEDEEELHPVPEKKQLVLLKGKLGEKVQERLRTIDKDSNLTQITEFLKECYAKYEVSKDKLRIHINRMSRDDFKNYEEYLKELFKLCEKYHMKEEKEVRDKLIIADIICKHDAQTQRAVENCGIKNPDDLVEFLKLREKRDGKFDNVRNKKGFSSKSFNQSKTEVKGTKFKMHQETPVNKKDNIICYACQSKGHYASECKTKGDSLEKVSRIETERKVNVVKKDKMKKFDRCPRSVSERCNNDLIINVKLGKKSKEVERICMVKGLIDTGSTVTIISEKEARYLGYDDNVCKDEGTSFVLANGAKWKAEGTMMLEICIEDVKIYNQVSIVKEEEICTNGKYNMIIGNDTLMAEGANINYATKEITFLGRLVNANCDSNVKAEGLMNRVSTVRREGTPCVFELKEKMKSAFPEVISDSKVDIGCCKLSAPKLQVLKQFPKAYRYKHSVKDKEIIKETIEQWLQIGAIKKCYNPSVIINLTVAVRFDTTEVVMKNDKLEDEVQIQVKRDTRNLKDEYGRLCKGRYFSKIDLRQFFLQIPLNEEDKTLLGIQCPVTNELYSWQRLPFGLNVSSSIAQSIINEVIENCEFKDENGAVIDENLYGVMAYIDDILIYTMEDSMQFHKTILFCMLKGLCNYGLKINAGKMELMRTEICYLNVILSHMKIRPNPMYIKGLLKMKKPSNVSELRRYLGAVNYCRDFIFGITELEKPLLTLLQKDQSYLWTDECERSYNEIQTMLKEVGFLKLPDQSREFILFVDASKYSESGLLMQMAKVNEIEKLWIEKESKRYPDKYKGIVEDLKENQSSINEDEERLLPVGYYSKKLGMGESASATLLEVRGLCRTLDHFKEVTKTSKVIAYTDHKPILQMLKGGKPESGRYIRYINRIFQYDGLRIRYLEGAKNIAADYMSRAYCRATRRKLIRVKEKGNEILVKDGNNPAEEGGGCTESQLNDEIQGKEEMEEKKLLLFKEIHDQQGHPYAEASIDMLEKRWPYENIKREYRNYVNNCKICIERNGIHKTMMKMGEFTADRPLQMVQMDCLGPLPTSERGYKHLLVWIDVNTRFVGGWPIPDLSHEKIVEAVEESLIYRYGMVENVKADNSKYFDKALEVLKERYKIGVERGVPYKHTSQSLVERVIQTLQNVISKTGMELLINLEAQWDKVVQRGFYAINNMKHATLRESPYFLMFGRRPLLSWDLEEMEDMDATEREGRISYLVDQQTEFEHQLCNRYSALLMKAVRSKMNQMIMENKKKEKSAVEKSHYTPEQTPRDRLNIKVGDPVAVFFPKKNKFEACWKTGYIVVNITNDEGESLKIYCKKKNKTKGRPLVRSINDVKLLNL